MVPGTMCLGHSDQFDQSGQIAYRLAVPVLEAIPAKPFSEAKSELSALMDQVVREHRPTLIERRREAMVALSLPDMRDLLASFRLEPRIGVGRKQTTATLDELGLVGAGRNVDAAIDDLLEELRAYAADFISRYSFYIQTDRRGHAPYVLRFALTPPDEQRSVLLEEPTEETPTLR